MNFIGFFIWHITYALRYFLKIHRMRDFNEFFYFFINMTIKPKYA